MPSNPFSLKNRLATPSSLLLGYKYSTGVKTTPVAPLRGQRWPTGACSSSASQIYGPRGQVMTVILVQRGHRVRRATVLDKVCSIQWLEQQEKDKCH
ncbi:hypothetical protein CDAR_409001 [Caerostris darwini]|uniref:Uncharacterized protein n=1 Tax=Caerostris darwini TaxID=1538125 RepID=A0AAV4PAI3_9ARAC|nr:hypothetical protein CDAR_409001 [Caerostris darwini]